MACAHALVRRARYRARSESEGDQELRLSPKEAPDLSLRAGNQDRLVLLVLLRHLERFERGEAAGAKSGGERIDAFVGDPDVAVEVQHLQRPEAGPARCTERVPRGRCPVARVCPGPKRTGWTRTRPRTGGRMINPERVGPVERGRSASKR